MRIICRMYDIRALICFVAMMGCVLLEVVARDMFSISTTWAEELSRFLFVWAVFLGAAAAWQRGAHIVIDVLPRRLPPAPRKLLLLVIHTFSALFLTCVWIGSIAIMIEQFPAKTTALEISISWFYLGLFAGTTGMMIFHVGWVLRTIRDPHGQH
jgi:TRAP-type C4-dicarboxylate transport system permease small subunit